MPLHNVLKEGDGSPIYALAQKLGYICCTHTACLNVSLDKHSLQRKMVKWLGYKIYFVCYYFIKLLFNQFQNIIIFCFMFLYISYTFIIIVQHINWRYITHINKLEIVHRI